MEEHCIKLIHRNHVSVVSGETSCLRTKIVVEWLSTKPKVVFLATIGFIPEQDVLEFLIIFLSLSSQYQTNIISKTIYFSRN